MSWYYSEQNERRGPVDEPTFRSLVSNGTITPETLVWREGMANWLPYVDVNAGGSAGPGLAPAPAVVCTQCGRMLPADEMVSYEGRYICPVCKPAFFQRVREGAVLPGERRYAGFWIRFVAYMIDNIIQQIVAMVIGLLIGMAMRNEAAQYVAMGVSLALSLAYNTYFVGRFGATPGKMALKLKIIRADGTPVSYGLAAGRFFAQFVSSIILLIGYIMAAFDEEKRSLHDRICDTRVIHE